MKPYVTRPLDEPRKGVSPGWTVAVRFVDSTGAEWKLWDAAHNATALTRREFAEWADAAIEGDHWCEFLFGPDQHGDRFDHVKRRWTA